MISPKEFAKKQDSFPGLAKVRKEKRTKLQIGLKKCLILHANRIPDIKEINLLLQIQL